MPENLIHPSELFTRLQIISGLRELADFLETNPAVPVDTYGYSLQQFTDDHCDKACRTQLEAVAELLDVIPRDETGRGGHLYASRSFGRITYEICHIPQRNRENFRALFSYESNLILDRSA